MTAKCLLYILSIWGENEKWKETKLLRFSFFPFLIASDTRFQNMVSIRMELSRRLMGVHFKILTDLTSWQCLPALIIGLDFYSAISLICHFPCNYSESNLNSKLKWELKCNLCAPAWPSLMSRWLCITDTTARPVLLKHKLSSRFLFPSLHCFFTILSW